MLKKIQRLIAATVIIYTILLLTIIGAFIYTQSNIYLKSAELLGNEQRMMIIKDMQNMKITYLILSFLFISISMLISKVLSKLVIAPSEELVKSAQAIIKGEDLDKKPLAADQNRDQMDELLDMFTGMNADIKEHLNEQTKKTNEINTIIQHLQDGVISFDIHGKITHLNPEAKNALDISEKDNFVKVCNKLGIDTDLEKIIYMEDITGIKEHIEIKNKIYNILAAVMKTSEDTADGIVIVLQEITKQVKLDEMRKQFVADVSHELKTPITSIIGYSDTIIESDDIQLEDCKYFVSKIDREAKRMSELVQDLLTLSRYDNTLSEDKREVFQVTELVKRIVEDLEPEAEKKDITMTCFITSDVPEIYADPVGIERVITNIIVNAIKYTSEGGNVQIYVGFLFRDTYIKVKDNGIGISKEDLKKVFERFYRVDSSRVRKTGGSGLGLSIVKEITNQNKGSVDIISELGKGTEVVLRFPTSKNNKDNKENNNEK